ncbi:hypothetical protein HAX54_024814 [Datura stramonium]|uniref:Uncharacterized protein n=1 Tax=Datura stramonium TaxID=4076 RepID=A0ABS8S7F9_DATST|nr:hypothetical protein [Datura stramonium]
MVPFKRSSSSGRYYSLEKNVQLQKVSRFCCAGRKCCWLRNVMDRTSFRSPRGDALLGQFVQLKSNVITPRFEWPQKREGGWATGRISQILPNGCLVVRFPGRMVFGSEPNTFLADPAEVIQVSFDTCPGIIEKYQHLEDFHWSIRPLSIAFTLLTAAKLGVSVGKCINAKLKKEPDLITRRPVIVAVLKMARLVANRAWFSTNCCTYPV